MVSPPSYFPDLNTPKYRPEAVNTPGGKRFRWLWYKTFQAEREFADCLKRGGLAPPYSGPTIEWFRAWMQRHREELER